MTAGVLSLLLPLALGGESSGPGETTFAGVLTILSIVVVVIVLGAVWYFFFRGGSQ
jgi:hypothetical protein